MFIAQSLFPYIWHESQSAAVDAVAFVGGGVEAFAFEDVAEMSFAAGADDFDADSAKAVIWAGFDILRFGWIVERWPAAAGFEFFLG